MHGTDLYLAYARNTTGPTFRIEIQRGPHKRWTTRWANMTLQRALMHYTGTVCMAGWRKRIVNEGNGKVLRTSDVEV